MSNRPSPALLLEHLVARLPGPAGPAGAAMVRVLADAAADFRRGRLHRDAAALAYFGLLSLIPLLSLGAWVVRVLAAPVLASPERTERLHAAIRSATEHAYPLLADQAAAVLGEIAATSDTGGLLGLAATLLAAGLLFRALSVSLSEVYGVERSRGFLGARIVAAVLLVSGGLAALTLLALREAAEGLAERFHVALPASLPLEGLLGTILEAVVVVAGFLVTVRVSLRGRLANRPLLLAGGLFWVFWGLAARVFGLYVEQVATLSRVYGPLAAAAALLLWSYYTAMMFLYCACVAARLRGAGASPLQTPGRDG